MKFPKEIFNAQRGQRDVAQWSEQQIKAEKSDYDIIMINNDVELITDEADWAKKYLLSSTFETHQSTTSTDETLIKTGVEYCR